MAVQFLDVPVMKFRGVSGTAPIEVDKVKQKVNNLPHNGVIRLVCHVCFLVVSYFKE
jgi:hypothetical protein